MRAATTSNHLLDMPMAMPPRSFNQLLTKLETRISLANKSTQVRKPKIRAMTGVGVVRLPGGAWFAGNGIAVLPIVDELMRRPSWLSQMAGLSTYEEITDALVELCLIDSVKGIVLDVDSPGGEANGCFDAADFIRKCAMQTGKPIWAVANETACSAAYALASATSKIWLPRTAHVGSVGVISTHIDQSARDARNGLKWTYIYAGANKTAFNPHEPLAPAALKAAQKEVDALYEIFVRQVAQNRRLTPAAVRASNADTYMGPDAVKAGFADKLGTFDQCLAAFAESLKQ